MALRRAANASNRDVVQVANKVFEQWQKDFARWCVVRSQHVSVEEKQAKLAELTGRPWTKAQLRTLQSAGLFREYVKVLREGGVPLARARIGEISPVAVENLAWAMEQARGKSDYNFMPKAAATILDKTLERSPHTFEQNVQINVTLSAKQEKLIVSERPILEAEIVESDSSTDE